MVSRLLADIDYVEAALLLLSLFVVYMNTVMVLSQPPMRITNLWQIRFMAFHQNMGLIYFALLAAMPLLGVSLMAVVSDVGRFTSLREKHRGSARRRSDQSIAARRRDRTRNGSKKRLSAT
jgi:hypothetical protein